MADILQTILARKAIEIQEAKAKVSLAELKIKAENVSKPRDFVGALLANINQKKPAIIAEIKKSSPSKGIIRQDFHPAELAKSYELGGASCLSVLTDRDFFNGDDEFVTQAKNACALPVLRKEFIVDTYQVYQSFILGADCILLIVAAFEDDNLLLELSEIATNLGMAVLVEVHNKSELLRALKLNLPLIGINNRNLKTFEITLQTTLDLLPLVPKNTTVITESAIISHKDIATMQNHGVYGFLVGESLMRQNDVTQAIKELINDES